MQKEQYYLGLDMGTNSVGWAVTDEKYQLIRKKGKDLWGIREFDEAETAASRRSYRISRRRRQREQVRIGKLNSYFHDAVVEKDPDFFIRLQNSKYRLEDKDETVQYKYAIFNDPSYTDKDYYSQYPTIFHLRSELIHDPEPHDIRLVYLALLNMMKHRGHFLSMGLSTESSTRGMGDAYRAFQEQYEMMNEDTFPDVDGTVIEEILGSRDMNRTGKAEKLGELFSVTKREKKKYAMIKAMCGLKADVKLLFEDLAESNSKLDLNSSDDEAFQDLLNEIGEDRAELIHSLKEIYDIGSLAGIMKGHKYLSDTRVEEYKKHKQDLKILKHLIHTYCSKEQYDEMFRQDGKNSYSAYIGSVNSGKKIRRNMPGESKKTENFYKTVKKLLSSMPPDDQQVQYVLHEIEMERFLPKQLTASNGVIPNQVHVREMKAILSNAEQYLPFLLEKDESELTVSERIMKLFSFQIPYYVGPLSVNSSKNGGNGWVVRKEDGEVLPWNFSEKVDLEKTSEEFIKHLIRDCTYLSGEKVLPKNSLRYQRFCVLNEINNLKIDGRRIDIALKQDLYEDVFRKGKRVTRKQLEKYLIRRGVLTDPSQLSGVDISINNALTSYGKFYSVFGDKMKTDRYFQLAEEIIFYSTIFGDSKKMLKKKIFELNEKYDHAMDDAQVKRILGFRFQDWGRLSAEFLELKGINKETGEVQSVLQAMWDSNLNLMQLLHSPDYTFGENLTKKQKKQERCLQELKVEDLDDYYFSPPVKRMVWQTLLIIQELEKIMGYPPERVFIEMTRSHAPEKGRTIARANQFRMLYKSIDDHLNDWNAVINHAEENGSIRSKKMYLYLTQMGRSMYTGNPIDLEELFSTKYDIDHIYPQHFVKDDNLANNMVLVEKEKNNHKSDNYPVEDSIRSSMSSMWKMLRKKNLITEEKYRRLTGTNPLSDEQKAGFIARQIVETSQSTKAVADLLREYLPDSTVIYSKAGNVSNFRQEYGLLKSRAINDFHHANDAYLNIVVGNVYYSKFTNNPLNFIRKEYHNGTDYNVNRMFEKNIIRGGKTAWLAFDKTTGNPGTICTVKNVMAKNTPILTRMSYEGHGQIADATLYSAKKAAGVGYIPIKSSDGKMQDVTKYGGFTKTKTAYFFVVDHELKGYRIRTLESVPIYLSNRFERHPEDLEQYCIEIGLDNPSIRFPKIKIGSFFKIDGFYYQLAGKTGNRIKYVCMVPMCLSQNWNNYIHTLEKEDKSKWDFEIITRDKNVALYDELTEKHLHSIFANRANSPGKLLPEKREVFCKLSLEDQCELLLELLKLSSIGGYYADLHLIGGASHFGATIMTKKISTIDEFKLINQSVTGLFTITIDLLKI